MYLAVMKQFKRYRDYSFFDQDIRLTKLSESGDPLEKLNKGIDFKAFRVLLEPGFEKVAKGKGGGRPFDFKNKILFFVNNKVAFAS